MVLALRLINPIRNMFCLSKWKLFKKLSTTDQLFSVHCFPTEPHFMNYKPFFFVCLNQAAFTFFFRQCALTWPQAGPTVKLLCRLDPVVCLISINLIAASARTYTGQDVTLTIHFTLR